jgi:hypothetical protein
LQSSITSKLNAAKDRLDLYFDDFELFDNSGQLLTSKSWSKLTKQTRQEALQIHVRWIIDDDAASRSSSSALSRIIDPQDTASVSSRRSAMANRNNGNDDAFFGMTKVSTGILDSGMCLNPQFFPFFANYGQLTACGKKHSLFLSLTRKFPHF